MPSYPDIEPYETGLLDTGDGNLVYWETCGNPDGVPALIVHGGPGSGCTAGNRRSFDPEKFQIIIFDQRNCGRSLPHASHTAPIEQPQIVVDAVRSFVARLPSVSVRESA